MSDKPADDFSTPGRGTSRRAWMLWLPIVLGFVAYIAWQSVQSWQSHRAPEVKDTRSAPTNTPSAGSEFDRLKRKHAAIEAQIDSALPRDRHPGPTPIFPEDGTNIVVEVRSRVAGLPGWRVKLGSEGWDVPKEGELPEDVRAALTAAVRELAEGPEPVRAEIRATERQPPHGLIMEVLDLFLSERITSVTFGTQDTDGTNFKPRDRVPAEAPPAEGRPADRPPEGAVPR